MTSHTDTPSTDEDVAFQTINIGRVPLLDVINAVQSEDEAALRAHFQSGDIDTAQFYSVVRDMAFSYTHTLQSIRTRHGLNCFEKSHLVLCPVVHSPAVSGTQAFNGPMDVALIKRLGDEMQVWGRQLSRAAVVTPLLDQARLSQMDVFHTRELLKQVTTRTFDPHQFDHLRRDPRLDIPVLSYLMVVMTRLNGAPFLPRGCAPCPAVHGLVEAFVKWSEHQCPDGPMAGFQPRVGSPMAAAEALESGLLMWLDAVHETHGIESWDVNMLCSHEFELNFVLRDATVEPVTCRLQPHHLGMDGVEHILAQVARLAGQRQTKEVPN